MDGRGQALHLAELGNILSADGNHYHLSWETVTERSQVQQEIKQLSHGLYLPFEIASESGPMVRFCILKRSEGVSVHLFPELSSSDFQPTGLRYVKAKRP